MHNDRNLFTFVVLQSGTFVYECSKCGKRVYLRNTTRPIIAKKYP